MKKSLFFAVFPAAAFLLSGCTSTSTPATTQAIPPAEAADSGAPEQIPAVQPTLLQEMQNLSVGIAAAGGLSAVGTSESKSLDLALNRAKVNGRKELSRILTDRFAALEKAFSEETGIPLDSLFLSGFNAAAKAINEQQIAGSIAQHLEYETSGDTFTAFALMVLDPKTIADQLAQQNDLFTRLQPTKAFAELDKEVKAYAAFKAAQKQQ